MTLRAHEKMVWDGLADKRLRKLFAANVPYREIAEIFGCSQSAIAGRVHRLGLQMRTGINRSRRAPNHHEKPSGPSLEGIFLNGEPLRFAEVDRPCARCAVRETQHHRHGCGQFAAEVRVRLK